MSGALSYVDAKAVDVSSVDASVAGACGLYVGTTGDVVVVMRGNTINAPMSTNVKFTGVPAGTTLRLHIATVVHTGTTAGALVALY